MREYKTLSEASVKSFMARQHQRPRTDKDRVGSGLCLTVSGRRKLPTRMRELPL
jgi:hypothetical protein